MWDNILPIMNEVYRLQPERTADLGIGFGKYGVLLREVLDGMYGRCRPDQWQRYILGVEGWDDYRNPSWGCYSEVRIQDFASADISGFDLVTMIDSFEHLDRDRGQAFLERLLANNRHVLISVPVGVSEQGAVHGNEYERHRTQFDGNEFNRYSPKVLHQSYCRVYSIQGKQ